MTKKDQSMWDEKENEQAGSVRKLGETVEGEAGSASQEDGSTAAESDGLEPTEHSLEEQLHSAREESLANHERYLRTVADWENYRRRMTREKEELRRHSVAGLVEEFLPVLDNLDLGLQSAANHPEATGVAQGFQMVADQIRGILEKNGVTEINPEGKEFDPHQHESLTHQPHAETPEGHVIQVIRKGYTHYDRLLRAAAVVVSSGPPATEDQA